MASRRRKRSSKQSSSKQTPKGDQGVPKGLGKKGKGKAPRPKIKKAQDMLDKKAAKPALNTSAFKALTHTPPTLEEITPAARQLLVGKLVKRPEPPPSEPVAKSLQALRPTMKRFHGMKVPLLWFPPGLFKPI